MNSINIDEILRSLIHDYTSGIGNITPYLLIKFFMLKTSNNMEEASQKAALWFTIDNPLLGDVKPGNMVLCGRTKKLMKFIISQIEENY